MIYLKDNNAIYTRANKLFRTDASHYEDKILKTEINRNKIKILGYLCDELILTCASGIQKYYFNTITAVNPKLFLNHNHGNLNKIISLIKSIPLMTIFFIESEGLELKSVASKIVKTKLEEKTFEVPKNQEIFEGNY